LQNQFFQQNINDVNVNVNGKLAIIISYINMQKSKDFYLQEKKKRKIGRPAGRKKEGRTELIITTRATIFAFK